MIKFGYSSNGSLLKKPEKEKPSIIIQIVAEGSIHYDKDKADYFLSARQLCNIFQCDLKTIGRMRNAGMIGEPLEINKKRLLFSKKEVENFLILCKHKGIDYIKAKKGDFEL